MKQISMIQILSIIILLKKIKKKKKSVGSSYMTTLGVC